MYSLVPNPETDAAIKQAIFAELFDKHSAPLYGMLMKFTNNNTYLSDKLLQEVFVEFFCHGELDIQTKNPPFIVLLRITIQAALEHGCSSLKIKQEILTSSIHMG